MKHKYSIGQSVYYTPSIKYAAQRGVYRVVGLRPPGADGQRVYRIKHGTEPHERAAKESELSVASVMGDALILATKAGSGHGKWE